ncbi:MAG: EpsG family protein [Bacilli bacterium]|nr:EpsG family protein [Bacilli bacterium]
MVLIMSFLSTILPIIVLPLVLLFLMIEKNNHNKKIYCVIFAIIVSFILYNFKPNQSLDLYRYYKLMDSFSLLDFSSFFKYLTSNIEPISNLLFYFFSKTNDNNLLIYFISLISYLIQIYIIFDYQEKKELSNGKFNVIIIYFLSTFQIIYYISGVRFCLARLLFFLALYQDFYKGKKGILIILLYMIPVLIHQSMLILLIFRLLLLINRNKFDFKFIIFFLLMFIIPNLIFNFTDQLSSSFSFLGLLSQRTEGYLNSGNNFSNIYKLQLCLLIIMIIYTLLIKYKKIETNNKMINYSLIVMFFSLVFYNSAVLSNRFISICSSYFILFLMDYIKSIKGFFRFVLEIIILIMSFVFLIFQFIQLKFGTYPLIFNLNIKITFISFIILLVINILVFKKGDKTHE